MESQPLRSPGFPPFAIASRPSHSLVGPAWQQLHAELTRPPGLGCSLPELGGRTLYHYCVAKVSGQASDTALAQAWLAQLTARLLPLSDRTWPPDSLPQACLLAWLSADGLAADAALLATLDARLSQEGLRLLAHSDAASRQRFFQVLRYFSLRLPAATTRTHLQTILDAWPGLLAPPPHLLSLAQGTAAELLICIRLARAGFQVAFFTHYVREGVRHLLATKRDVDFLQQRYTVFPDELGSPAHPPVFSAELTWRRGDLGQALLLYEAHALLQDPELAKFADLVGLHSLLRTTKEATEVIGASLYRGTAGVAQLYAQLYRQSHQAAYLSGYEFWLGQTQSWLQANQLSPADPPVEPVEDPLRHGLLGVALVLLSASTSVELGWEASLLGAG